MKGVSMGMTKVDVTIENDENSIWGDAKIPIIDLVVDWEYIAHKKNKVGINAITMDGGVAIHFDEDDALYQHIVTSIEGAVREFLGRAEVAAEVAKDEAVDMAIDDMIERRHEESE